MLDGKRQRNALTAAERALQALAAGDGERAVRSAGKAAELDQLGVYEGFPETMATAASELAASGVVTGETWDMLEGEVGPGPLQFLIRELRG